ncbi:AsmA-like C-terminal region-containing protein [Desertivirga brevis]|uniref:AsmA-like C-terminal region-containing protein n=1 Tax=Desertivirga brevis TaxID=2810310 RepID=UPI001A9635ED|nr:AsmA-like C-terminal region-containing protein [Pedobacter sp. SYSU D00873]
MNRFVKVSLIVIGVFTVLILIMWLGVAAYVTINKREILEKVTLEINKDIRGHLTIESMEPSLIQGFPGVAVSLKNVLLRDSLYKEHKHDLLRARQIYVAVNSFSLISGKPTFQWMSVEDAEIYLYTDSLGYKNTEIFKPSAKGGGGKPKNKFNRIELRNVKFVYDNRSKDKFFDFSIRDFKGKIKYYPNDWKAKVKINTMVRSLTFKTSKGSFIKEQLLQAELDLNYNHVNHILSIPSKRVHIGGQAIDLGGDFSFAPNNSDFSLNIKAQSITYEKVLLLVTPQIANALKRYKIEKPFLAAASIRGKSKGADTPLVNVSWAVKNSRITLTGEPLENCTFTGSYSNEVIKGKPRLDPNSIIVLRNFVANWRGIPFRSDSLKIINLKFPVLQGRFVSNFKLRQLNEASGSETFLAKGGSASINLFYKAPLNSNSVIEPFIAGTVTIKNGELNYVPRALLFKNVNGQLNFQGQDLYLKDFVVQTAFSKLYMRGAVKNFVNFYYTDPQRIILDWNISSPQIDLKEFLAFLAARRQVKGNYRKNKIGRLFRQLNNVLDEASVHLELKSDKLRYKRFAATNTHANLNLNQDGITIKDVSLRHAGGELNISGDIAQKATSTNPFRVISRLRNVDIQHLFYAFEDFGQQSITSKNIKGKFSALVNVKGLMNQSGTIVPRSFTGKVDFKLKNGALIGYAPMKKVGKIAFPNRDFSNITINDLSNTLIVKGDKIEIPKMTVMTSVLNMIVEGTYGIGKGTNIGLQIPIRNPERDKDLPDSLKQKRITRGIVLNLTATDDENGNLRVKLGKKDDDEKEKESEKAKNKAEARESRREKKAAQDSLKR